jgi:hypothetical protein
VRIAMTVGTAATDATSPWLGRVVKEGSGLTPEMEAEAVIVEGRAVDVIHADLSAGADVSRAVSLKANDGLASPGMKLHGAGFIVTPSQWEAWGRPAVVHPYRNGKDLTDKPRGVMVIDFYGLDESEARTRFPGVYQHVLDTVKPERDQNNRAAYRDRWWIYGEARSAFRPALASLPRYIATVETAKHRVFQFLDGATVPDNMLIAIASDDGFQLGILSSRGHGAWALAAGGTLESRPRYNKTRCFDPFPFPEAAEPQKVRIRELAEALDSHRKAAQGRGVTITAMYNLLTKLRAGEMLNEKEQALHTAAQTSILRQLHDDLDAEVAAAYGWPANLPDEAILEKLVALNRERAEEEKRGLVHWLRPDYQAPDQKAQVPVAETPVLLEETLEPLPIAEPRPWPSERRAQLAMLRELLLSESRSWSLEELARCFKSRGRYRDSIQTHLEVLEDLGLALKIDVDGSSRWQRPSVTSSVA